MIGIVIVSHSRKLAHEIIEFSKVISNTTECNIVNASGLDNGNFGTSEIIVKDAINKAYDENGVIILADIGSSISSSVEALKLLDKKKLEHVIISTAPLLEGTLIALTLSSVNTPLKKIVKEIEMIQNIHFVKSKRMKI